VASPDKGKLEFISKLKGKRLGGELHNWVLREVPDPQTGEILGHLAYGWLNGVRTWRTSAVLEVFDADDDGNKLIETRNTYYTLVGDEASEEQRAVLYRVIF